MSINLDFFNARWTDMSKWTRFASVSFLITLFFSTTCFGGDPKSLYDFSRVVTDTKKIFLSDFPNAHNPSLIKYAGKLLLVFRYCPNLKKPWISVIGVVFLNDKFEPISKPQILNVPGIRTSPSQTEDARVISCNGQLYLVYNDNMEITYPIPPQRRDMHITPLQYENGQFMAGTPIKLTYQAKLQYSPVEKNWTPFVWNNNLLMIFSITPHDILLPDLLSGSCESIYETKSSPISWEWADVLRGSPDLRGGTPALLVDGEYLAFFHSSFITRTKASNDKKMRHYYMGAYTFSANPPFEVTSISPYPIVGKGFYTKSNLNKRVIFPGGFIVSGSNIYLAYGKDDSEIWIATINKQRLKNTLIPVETQKN